MPARSAAAVVCPESLRHPGGARLQRRGKLRDAAKVCVGQGHLGLLMLWCCLVGVASHLLFLPALSVPQEVFESSGLFAYILIGRPSVGSA